MTVEIIFGVIALVVIALVAWVYLIDKPKYYSTKH